MGNWDGSKQNNDGERELIDRAVKALEAELATKTCNKQIVSKLEDAELARNSEETCNNKQVTSKLVASEDAISRQAAIDAIGKDVIGGLNYAGILTRLPSVTPMQRTGWIPFTYRPATDEEKKDYAERIGYDEEDIDTILNCQLPEDGETVLITDRLGNVEVDTFINDCDECYFECNCDMEDVRAWMPLPKPYEPQESEEISREEIAALLARESEEQA